MQSRLPEPRNRSESRNRHRRRAVKLFPISKTIYGLISHHLAASLLVHLIYPSKKIDSNGKSIFHLIHLINENKTDSVVFEPIKVLLQMKE